MKKLLLAIGPHEDLRGWTRTFVTAGASGLFLAISGAFGSGEAPLLPRIGYWLGLMLLGSLWGAFVVNKTLPPSDARRGARLWSRAALAAVLMAVPFTLVVFAASHLILGASFRLASVPFLFFPVLLVSLAMVGINIAIETGGRSATTTSAAAPPKFLERLPLKLRGAEVWAVEAEDHYLRLHTSKGQDLILMRLADAVAELDGLEGMQVHRSWWVARDAIVDARRGDGRATLRLKDGSEVPVSRTYAGELRDKGWI